MSSNYNSEEMEVETVVDVGTEGLESNTGIITSHLETSTAVLHDILEEDDGRTCDSGHICQHCGKIYKTASTLQRHRLLKHPVAPVEAQCNSFNKMYPSIVSLRKHVEYKHRYIHKCNVCYKGFETTEKLESHKESCTKIETPCSVCGKVYMSPIAHRNHMKYKHPEGTSHWCGLCRRAFSTQRGLADHAATLHTPGATDCRFCPKTFLSVPALQSHELYKHREDGSKCPQCYKVFATQKSLTRHLSKSHAIKKYTCRICFGVLRSSRELYLHVILQHYYPTGDESGPCGIRDF